MLPASWVWVRRPSHSLRVIFLCSQPLKSRAHFPALVGWWTKSRCDLALLELEKLSRLVWGSVAAAGAASCDTQVLQWQSSCGCPGVGDASQAGVSLLIPPRGNKTGHKSLLQDVQQWGIWKCSPLFLPVLLPSFATPEAR